MITPLFATAIVLTVVFAVAILYDIHYHLKPHMRTLYLIRGLPGSGKSTLARTMAANLGIQHFESDMFFMQDGVYRFDRTKLQEAHDWCYDNAARCMHHGQSVIVSNTFTRWREMREYVDEAAFNGFNVEIIHCLGDFGSVHNVPADVMTRMRERFIPNEQLPQIPEVKYSTHNPVSECASMLCTP